MMPLQKLLSRIQWDPEFGKGSFMLGYDDHVAGRLVFVDLVDVKMDATNHSLFNVVDQDGETRSIPFHRVKQVFKDGVLIWERAHQEPCARSAQWPRRHRRRGLRDGVSTVHAVL